MADYYPLLARAVAALPDSTPETRRAIYDRARKALVGQLQRVDPPVPEDDIARELSTLEQAVRRIEDEASARGKVTPPASPAPPPAPPTSRSASPPAEKPKEPTPAKPSFSIRPPGAERPWATGKAAAPKSPAPAVQPAPAAPAAPAPVEAKPVPPPAPSRPPKLDPPAERPAPPAPPPSAIPRPQAPSTIVPPIARERIWPPPPAVVPPPTADVPAPAAMTASVQATPRQSGPALAEAASNARPQILAAPAVSHGGHGETQAPSVSLPDDRAEGSDDAGLMSRLRVFGRPRAGGEEFSDVLDATEQGEFPDRDMRAESIRPIAPQPPRPKESLTRYWVFAAVLLLVVGAIAALAFRLRDNPEDFTRVTRPNPATADPEQTNDKIVDRIGAGPTSRADATPATAPKPPAPVAPPRTDVAAPAPTPIQPPTTQQPVIHRATLLVKAPDDPQRVKTYVGTVLWHIENPASGPPVLAADIDLGEAQFRASIRIVKNTDPRLPASHTIDLRFSPAPGGPIPGIKEIDLPQMRLEDRPDGEALSGITAAITTNYFLIGLTAGDIAQTRNLYLLSSSTWIDLPLLLSSGKVATITFEKGTTGQHMLESVMASWRSGG